MLFSPQLGFQIDVEKFFIFFLTLALLAFSAASLAFAISSRVAVVGVANLLISMMYVLSMVREQNNSHFFNLYNYANYILVCPKLYLYLCLFETHVLIVQYHTYAVKPPNKGHVGDNKNSHALSLVERLSSSRRFKLYCYYRETKFSGPRELSTVQRFLIQCPFLRGSTIGSFTIIWCTIIISTWFMMSVCGQTFHCYVAVLLVC